MISSTALGIPITGSSHKEARSDHDNDRTRTRVSAPEEKPMLSTQKAARHANLVASTVSGSPAIAEVDHRVRDSWTRCLQHYSLDPQQPKKATVVDRNELQARRERLGLLLSIARVELLSLRKRLQSNDFGIVLTDEDGVILHYVGDPGFATTARRSGLREGAVWSERELGTNGMGTCIVEQRSVVIHQHQHFLAQNTELTCSAAPIFDATGKLIAALDISGSFTKAQPHTLALVEIAAQNIENRTMIEGARQRNLLRFHRHAEFISTPGEGLLAYDDEGLITGINRSALDLLGEREHRMVCGQRLDLLFDGPQSALLAPAARRSQRPQPIVAHGGHQKLWGLVQAPEREGRANAGTTRVVIDSSRAAGPLAGMEYGDPTMAANIRIVQRVLDRDIPILLLGETGTGKGLFAKAIHAASRRADKPFIAVNCAAIPETLIESELFGYKAGAFTGATREGHSGRVMQANGGTLFLDEIGDMPLPLQVRLLSVIEDREVVPLGGSKAVPVDIRVISATHGDLPQLVRDHRFREDLFYRLNGIALRMPPLRERRDSAELLRAVMADEARSMGAVSIDDAVVRRLLQFDWPGNLRQLRNVLRTMLALCDGERLTMADFNEDWLFGGIRTESPALAAPVRHDGEDVLGSAERDALRRVLETCRWNVSAAAIQLKVSRKTLYRKMSRHDITRRELHETEATATHVAKSNRVLR